MPKPTPDPIERLRQLCQQAENSVRITCTGKLPPDLELSLKRIGDDTVDKLAVRYATLRLHLVGGGQPKVTTSKPGEPEKEAQDAALAVELTVNREPVILAPIGGSRVAIYDKSPAWHDAAADVWAWYVWLGERADEIRARGRLTDWAALRRIREARAEILHELIAQALDPAPNMVAKPRPVVDPAALSASEVGTLISTLNLAGRGRLLKAVPYFKAEKGGDGEPEIDPVRSGFGAWAAGVTKRHGLRSVQALRRLPYAQTVVADLLSAPIPSPDEEAETLGL